MKRLNKAYMRQDNPNQFKQAAWRDLIYIACVCLIVVGAGSVVTYKAEKARALIQTKVFAANVEVPVVQTIVKEIKVNDARPDKLRAFLIEKNSPLAEYSDLIVSEADKYGLDWTKLVAISGMESKYGTILPIGSHNAWGIGGSNFIFFTSWEEGIAYTSSLLGNHYKENENQAIKAKYCPASDNCNPQWAKVVTSTSNTILSLEGN